MLKHFLIFLSLTTAPLTEAKVLISTVAQVKNHVITSREIAIHGQIDKALGKRFQNFSDKKNEEEVIREWLLFFEASSFYNSELVEGDIKKNIGVAKARLAKSSHWKKLGVTSAELRKKIKRKMEAERIYTFKKKASVLPVTLAEIENEYTQNRIRYGNQKLEEVKDKIRSIKVKENLYSRMEQWFSVLEKKYKVQRFSKFTEGQ